MAIWKILGLEKFVHHIVKRADAVTAVSSALGEEITSIGGNEMHKKVSVIPMGIYVDQFHKQKRTLRKLSKDTATRFVFVGRHAQEKSLSTLLDAFKILKGKGYAFTATIAGDGPERNHIEKKAIELGLEKELNFPGYVHNSQVADIFYDHDILVNCSVREGLPTVFMEAMATSLPIIVTNTQGIADMVQTQENGIIVPMKDAAAIADACIELIQNSGKYQSISEKGLQTAYMYDWKIISKQFEDVLLP
jgi:glycosyltransferase involved in cell wall biosynthesis